MITMAKKETTKTLLNQAVADLSQFSAIIHQTHWYLRGPRFLALHPKMDAYREEIEAQLDSVAERLIAIGGAPFSTLSEFSTGTKLKDRKGDFGLSEDEHLQRLLEGYQYIAGLYQQGIDAASEEDDAVTEDLFTGLKGPIDTNIWMISATLGKDVPQAKK